MSDVLANDRWETSFLDSSVAEQDGPSASNRNSVWEDLDGDIELFFGGNRYEYGGRYKNKC
jgi:hypothetical protein